MSSFQKTPLQVFKRHNFQAHQRRRLGAIFRRSSGAVRAPFSGAPATPFKVPFSGAPATPFKRHFRALQRHCSSAIQGGLQAPFKARSGAVQASSRSGGKRHCRLSKNVVLKLMLFMLVVTLAKVNKNPEKSN